jgi:hypothetical protein
MIAEIRRKRGRIIIRVHDIGDYFSDDYLRAWLTVMVACPQARFYSYTKEVDRFRQLVTPDPPTNFAWVYSYGGTQDMLLNDLVDRVADVFPTAEALRSAGYNPQSSSDLLAVDGPAPVGIIANNIARFRNLQGSRTFRGWQAEADRRRPSRRSRRPQAVSTKAPRAGSARSS